MGDKTSTSSVESLKPGYSNRPSPIEVPKEFREDYIAACLKTNELLVDADRYFAHDEIYGILDDEEDNFRENKDYELEVSEIVGRADLGELIDEDKFYDKLVGKSSDSDAITGLSEWLSITRHVKSTRDNIGQNMFYDDPVAWMMYKREAYSSSDVDSYDEMATLQDLADHANGQDLCQNRWQFLNGYIGENMGWRLYDLKEDEFVDFEPDMPLEEAYTDPRMLSLFNHQDFIGNNPQDVDRVVTSSWRGSNEIDKKMHEIRTIAHIADIDSTSLFEQIQEDDGRIDPAALDDLRQEYSWVWNTWKSHEFDEDGKWANFTQDEDLDV